MFLNALKVRILLLPVLGLVVSCSSYESSSYSNVETVELVHNMQTYKLYVDSVPSANSVKVDESFVEERMLSVVEGIQEAHQLSHSIQSFNPVGAYKSAFNLVLSSTVGFAQMFGDNPKKELYI